MPSQGPEMLLHETSEAAISDFIDNRALMGKFVRFGDLIILASSKKLFSMPLHREIAFAACVKGSDPGLRAKVKAAAQEVEPKDDIGKDYVGIVDAGYFRIDIKSDTPRLLIQDRSSDFGRADEAGRQRTGELAQLAIGQSIEVEIGK